MAKLVQSEGEPERAKTEWKVIPTRADLLEDALNSASAECRNVEYLFADANTGACLMITKKIISPPSAFKHEPNFKISDSKR